MTKHKNYEDHNWFLNENNYFECDAPPPFCYATLQPDDLMEKYDNLLAELAIRLAALEEACKAQCEYCDNQHIKYNDEPHFDEDADIYIHANLKGEPESGICGATPTRKLMERT